MRSIRLRTRSRHMRITSAGSLARRPIPALALAVTLAVIGAPAAAAAPPAVTSNPTIEGAVDHPFVGDTLRANNGSWTGSPTKFAYQWDRCDPVGDRRNCAAITGATNVAYRVRAADADHTLRVRVTATNADGSTTKDSKGTGVVSG